MIFDLSLHFIVNISFSSYSSSAQCMQHVRVLVYSACDTAAANRAKHDHLAIFGYYYFQNTSLLFRISLVADYFWFVYNFSPFRLTFFQHLLSHCRVITHAVNKVK